MECDTILKFIKEKEGFWAECIELPGCVTQADTKEELDSNMQEALNLYLEEVEESEYLAIFLKRQSKKVVILLKLPLILCGSCFFYSVSENKTGANTKRGC